MYFYSPLRQCLFFHQNDDAFWGGISIGSQGDQIGRFFANRAIFFSFCNFLATFFYGKSFACIGFDKKISWATHWTIFKNQKLIWSPWSSSS
jgi:hypothetical protein